MAPSPATTLSSASTTTKSSVHSIAWHGPRTRSDTNTTYARSPPMSNTSNLRTYIRQELQRLSERQENLNEDRETVLLERASLRSHGKHIHNQRVTTGDAEAALMNELRKFSNEHGVSLPDALTSQYDRVIQERTKLATLEVDWFRNEQALGGKEWEFLERETDFYQYDLREILPEEDSSFGELTVPEQPSLRLPEQDIQVKLALYRETAIQLRLSTNTFNSLRPRQWMLLARKVKCHGKSPITQFDSWGNIELTTDTFDNSEFTTYYHHVLEEFIFLKAKTRQLSLDLMQFSIPARIILFPSLVNQPLEYIPVSLKTTSQDLLDGELPTALNGLPKAERLLDWMLEHLLESTLEQIYFRIILQDNLEQTGIYYFNYDLWEAEACQFWLYDTCGPLFALENSIQPGSRQPSPYSDTAILPKVSQSRSLPNLASEIGRREFDSLPPHPQSDSGPTTRLKSASFPMPNRARPPPLLDKSLVHIERFMETDEYTENLHGARLEDQLKGIGDWFCSIEWTAGPETFVNEPELGLPVGCPSPGGLLIQDIGVHLKQTSLSYHTPWTVVEFKPDPRLSHGDDFPTHHILAAKHSEPDLQATSAETRQVIFHPVKNGDAQQLITTQTPVPRATSGQDIDKNDSQNCCGFATYPTAPNVPLDETKSSPRCFKSLEKLKSNVPASIAPLMTHGNSVSVLPQRPAPVKRSRDRTLRETTLPKQRRVPSEDMLAEQLRTDLLESGLNSTGTKRNELQVLHPEMYCAGYKQNGQQETAGLYERVHASPAGLFSNYSFKSTITPVGSHPFH